MNILTRELSKKTRRIAVRRLIQRIPNLLQKLKPCFLMSPLAVSQYLPAGPLESDHLQFDTVIFDEASQVVPEDALPAIERARQVIVVGDQHQLPPTTFFQVTIDDEDTDHDDEDDKDSFEGRESILDVMVGNVGCRHRGTAPHCSLPQSLREPDPLLEPPVSMKDAFSPSLARIQGKSVSETNTSSTQPTTWAAHEPTGRRPSGSPISCFQLMENQSFE